MRGVHLSSVDSPEKAVINVEPRSSLCCQLEQPYEQTVDWPVLWDPMMLMQRHCNGGSLKCYINDDCWPGDLIMYGKIQCKLCFPFQDTRHGGFVTLCHWQHYMKWTLSVSHQRICHKIVACYMAAILNLITIPPAPITTISNRTSNCVTHGISLSTKCKKTYTVVLLMNKLMQSSAIYMWVYFQMCV